MRLSKNVWRFSQSSVPKHPDQLYTSVAGRRTFGHSTPSTALPIPLTDAHVKPKMADLDLKGAPWTDAEDVQLSALQVRTLPPHNRAIAKRFLTSVAFLHHPCAQAKHGNRWAAVAAEMPGRTGQQCAQRWRHKVNPNIRKDKWTEAEDRQVRAPQSLAVDRHRSIVSRHTPREKN